jgi:nitroreductase
MSSTDAAPTMPSTRPLSSAGRRAPFRAKPSLRRRQPWRFIYALRGTPHFEKLLGLLNEFNRGWAKSAGAIVFVISKSNFAPPGTTEEKPAYAASFDTGAAWAALAHQATLLGLHTHGMIGLEFAAIPAALNIPEGYRIEAGIAIGKLGDKTTLPEGLQARETPSPRLALSDIAFEGSFKA